MSTIAIRIMEPTKDWYVLRRLSLEVRLMTPAVEEHTVVFQA